MNNIRAAAAASAFLGGTLLAASASCADIIHERALGFVVPIDGTYGTRFFLNVLPAHMPVNFNELSASENRSERLFEQFLLFPSNVGQTFTVTAGVDPAFAPAVARLTDGLNNACFRGIIGTQLIGGQPVPAEVKGGVGEHELLFLNQGPRVDLAGHEITAIHLRLDSLQGATLMFEGTMIPDPGAGTLGLLAAGTGTLIRTPRRGPRAFTKDCSGVSWGRL